MEPSTEKAIFDGLKAMREVTNAVEASARDFKKMLEANGWSDSVAEYMAYGYFATVMEKLI